MLCSSISEFHISMLTLIKVCHLLLTMSVILQLLTYATHFYFIHHLLNYFNIYNYFHQLIIANLLNLKNCYYCIDTTSFIHYHRAIMIFLEYQVDVIVLFAEEFLFYDNFNTYSTDYLNLGCYNSRNNASLSSIHQKLRYFLNSRKMI